MRIHHVNAATMCPFGGRLVTGRGFGLGRAEQVCHCLVIETRAGLVVVETGLGTADVRDPTRLPRLFRTYARPRLAPEEPLVARLEGLGFAARDVRHVALTHLDLDHAGGLGDLPHADVHLSAVEHRAALEGGPRGNAWRTLAAHFDHAPRWVVHEEGGETWKGFAGVRPLLPGRLDDEILLVPLAGHSRGHTGVAVREPGGWLLHAGDAYFHPDEVELPTRRCPAGAAAFQWFLAEDNAERLANQARLRALATDPTSGVRMVCSHDPSQLARAQAHVAQRAAQAPSSPGVRPGGTARGGARGTAAPTGAHP